MRYTQLFYVFVVIVFGCAPTTDYKPQTTDEIRGVWITNIDSDVMFSREATAEAMKYLADRGFNVVFPVVWNEGYTLYPSEVMARTFGEAYRIDTVFARQGRDPLAELIIEAHRHGLEVMPWFEFGFSSSYNTNGGHILAAKPDWAAIDRNGNLLKKNNFEWMNPNHPQVQQLLLNLVDEVIRTYDVDGIQGDDRLPANPAEGGYDALSRAMYKDYTGNNVPDDPREPVFLQWKADKLSDFGGRLYTLVKSHDSDLIVSLSPSVYPWSKDEYLQDSPEWIRRGQVDILHPQAYRYEIDRYKTTADEVALHGGLTDSSNTTVHIAPGILIKSGMKFNGPDYVKEAMLHNRTLGMHGEVFFFYEGLREQNQQLGDSLKAWFYQEPAGLPYRNGEPRRFRGIEVHDTAQPVRVTGNYRKYRLQEGAWMYSETVTLRTEASVPPDSVPTLYLIDRSKP